MSDRRCILVENEIELSQYFTSCCILVTQAKNNKISTSADSIGNKINRVRKIRC